MAEGDYDYQFKVIMVGSEEVEKHHILHRLDGTGFDPDEAPASVPDSRIKVIHHNGKAVKMQVWNSARKETFRTVISAYYRDAKGIFLMYDIANEETFNSLPEWVKQIEQNAVKGVHVILLGNNCDGNIVRQVSSQRGQEFAREHGYGFFEVSGRTDHNIEEACLQMAIGLKNINKLDKAN